MTKNKGYSLIELIIVIAIMMILSGMTFVTLGIIKDAKRSAAANTFNNQISSCLIKTKAISDVYSVSDPSAPVPSLCLVIQKRTSDNTYAIMLGYNNGSKITLDSAGTTELDPNDESHCEAILPKEVESIVYTPSDTAQQYSSSGDKMVIQFIKSYGSLKYGAGTYDLHTTKNGTDQIYATINLDKVSGKHDIH